ncbi:MAG: sulfatase-like hydrolase/transferase [Rikenellaceae bacterium]
MNLNYQKVSLLSLLGVMVALPNDASAKKTQAQTPTQTRPNVILINVDDMGWGDPSCYGGKVIETPNIDRLAATGVRFTDGYVTAPVSGVSRMGLLTGSYQQRYGIQWNHDQYNTLGRDPRVLPEAQRQIQSAFKDAGYVTAMAGKRGINDLQTFDYYYSQTENGANYFPDENGIYANVDVLPGEKSPIPMNRGIVWGPERPGEEHLTDRCGRQCIEFIDAHKDEPFFFYMAFNAPHTPLHAKMSDLPRVAHIKSDIAKLYAALVLGVDDNVGRIVDHLEKLGLRDNTIIVFLSDNGPANPFHLSVPDWWPEGLTPHLLGQRNGLNGYKGTMWEAGIKIPYIISWPAQLAQGETYSQMVSTLDIYPTLCSAARIRVPDNTTLDGEDLLPYMLGDYEMGPHESLYWYANRMGAVRKGKWKMLIEEDYHYLFDLESDMGEKVNVMRQNPEVMNELLDEYFEFRNGMPAYRNPYLRPIDIRDEAVIGLEVVDAF